MFEMFRNTDNDWFGGFLKISVWNGVGFLGAPDMICFWVLNPDLFPQRARDFIATSQCAYPPSPVFVWCSPHPTPALTPMPKSASVPPTGCDAKSSEFFLRNCAGFGHPPSAALPEFLHPPGLPVSVVLIPQHAWTF